MPFELAAALLNLCAHGIAVSRHERQKSVRCAAGDDFQFASLEKTAKAVDQVVAVLLDEHVTRPREAVVVHVGELIEVGLPARALDLLAGQRDEVIEMADIAVL